MNSCLRQAQGTTRTYRVGRGGPQRSGPDGVLAGAPLMREEHQKTHGPVCRTVGGTRTAEGSTIDALRVILRSDDFSRPVLLEPG